MKLNFHIEFFSWEGANNKDFEIFLVWGVTRTWQLGGFWLFFGDFRPKISRQNAQNRALSCWYVWKESPNFLNSSKKPCASFAETSRALQILPIFDPQKFEFPAFFEKKIFSLNSLKPISSNETMKIGNNLIYYYNILQ